MTFLEIQDHDGKRYYYLTKSFRIGRNKWSKLRHYLGNKKPSKKEISAVAEKMKKEFFKEIKKLKLKNLEYLSENNAEFLEDVKEGYLEWIKDSTPEEKKRTNEDFVIRFTYNTNAIEGNRLTLKETSRILKDKKIPSGIEANDYHEAINGRACLEFIKTINKKVFEEFLCKINNILLKDVSGVIYPGRIRFFPVKITNSKHEPLEEDELKKHLKEFFKWHKKNKNILHPFEMAVLVHGKIAWMHPFEDGNGRTARVTMNKLLYDAGYPMFFIPFDKRMNYYQALEKFDKGQYKEYIEDMFKMVRNQLKTYGHKKQH